MTIFYSVFLATFLIFLTMFFVSKFIISKDKNKFDKFMNKFLKILTVLYCVFVLINIFLPDGFTLSLDKDYLGTGRFQGYAILRWLSCIPFVVFPIAVFSKNKIFCNIAVYFCTIVTIVSLCFYSTHLEFFTAIEGRGLNSISILSNSFKSFMLNPTFRSIYWGMLMMFELAIPIMLAVQEKVTFNFKRKSDLLSFAVLPFVILSSIPIYVPQYLFGHTNLIFSRFSVLHFAWLLLSIAELIVLYFIFRKKDMQVKKILLFVLSLSLILQYSQMFGAVSISMKRMPLQLCNLGAYFILISLLTMNKRIFNFTLIINVVGVLFALAMPDLDGEGLFYLYNMHFVFEHTNVLIVPILALLFKLFPRLDKYALRDCLIGFSIYFVSVFVLGTIFNAVASATNNDFYEANYMFMFSKEKAIEVLPFTEALFNINFKIGHAVFYPIVQLLIYAVFLLVCVAMYFVIKLIYYIRDIRNNKRSLKC